MQRIVVGNPPDGDWIDIFWDKETIGSLHHHDLQRQDGLPTLDIIEFDRETISLETLIKALQTIPS